MRRVLVLLALFALVPTAGAHIEGFSQARSLPLGPYQAYVEPQPTTIYANSTLSFSALITDNATGGYVTTLSATMVLRGPNGWTKTLNMTRDSTGYLLASLVMPGAGNYSADFVLHDKDRDYSSSTSFVAYPDLPFRIASADPGQDVYAGSRTPIAIEVTDPLTGERVDKFDDLEISMERWKDDHSAMLGHDSLTPKRDARGLWKVDYTFKEPGMYHLRFASRSGAFNYDEVPILHLYATDPALGGSAPAKKGVPEPGVGLVVLALAGLVLARRR